MIIITYYFEWQKYRHVFGTDRSCTRRKLMRNYSNKVSYHDKSKSQAKEHSRIVNHL